MSKIRTGTWVKMSVATVVLCVGGPALVFWVTPSEEELFKRYSPELQKRVLEERPQREKELQEFASKMIEYSKSSKPIWVLQAEDAKKKRKELIKAERERAQKAEDMKQAMLREQITGAWGSSLAESPRDSQTAPSKIG